MTKVTYSMPVLLVSNIELSTRFYQDLFGLEIEHDFGENVVFSGAFSLWQRDYARQIIHGGTREGAPGCAGEVMELYFESEDIEAFWDDLCSRDGLEIVHELREEPWAQRTVRFLDPDGFVLEVAEPMRSVVRRLHRQGVSLAGIQERTHMTGETIKSFL